MTISETTMIPPSYNIIARAGTGPAWGAITEKAGQMPRLSSRHDMQMA
ncbi:hypothetical protein SXCC_01720 [Gluconacetobacter sp. SXCC-1]|nr:hypothetical protein SXCC_01720 [Gluconacetobacter sp. SXCC-1]